jgi:hypothetical protein
MEAVAPRGVRRDFGPSCRYLPWLVVVGVDADGPRDKEEEP